MDEILGKQRGMEKDDCRALELPVSPCGEVATATVPSEGPTPSPYVQTGTPSLHCDPSVARRCLSTPPAHSDVRVAPSLHSTPISHHPQVRQSGRPNVFDDDTNAETAHLPARHSTLPPNPCEHPRPATSVVGSRELHAYATAVNQGKRTSAERRSEDICCESSLILQDVDPSTGRLLTRHLCRSFLGGGGFGMVFECTDMISKATYACKVIEAPMRINDEICCPDEIAIHRLLNHPNILKYVRYFYTHKHTFVLLERCISENLKHILDRKRHFSEAEVRFIMRQLCSAVNYMHKHDFIHRDIKLGNIMVDYAGNVKLGDFGFAKRCLYPHGRVRGGCGTPHYVAPEILLSRKVGSDYGLEVDIWSLGVVFFNLAYGFQPFRSSDEESTYERIRIGDYTFPDHPSVSESCKSLIASMLSLDPALRPTAEQVLESPFLADPLCFAGCQLSHRSKPRQPSVFVSMSLFDPTYGSLFMLCCDGRSVPVMVFNDLTKMRISDGEDGKKMEVYYVDRTREEHGGSGYVDERYHFSMDRNSDVPQFDSNKLISCAAQKRLGIIRYLRPFTTKSLSDPRHLLIFTPHLLHQLRSSKKLYKGPSHPEGPLFVKEAVTYPLQELFKDHRAGNSSGVAMAARFSNGSYQVSFHLEEDSDPDFSPITGGGVHGPASEQEQWDLHVNVLCYSKSPTHAQIDITKDKEACMFTIFNVRTDAQYNSFGKTFFAAGSAATSGYKQAPTEVSLPHKLLKLIGELLSRVRCPSWLIECFVKPKVPDDVTVLDCCEGH